MQGGDMRQRPLRMYPDQELRKIEGEFRGSLIDLVRENFPKMTRGK